MTAVAPLPVSPPLGPVAVKREECTEASGLTAREREIVLAVARAATRE